MKRKWLWLLAFVGLIVLALMASFVHQNRSLRRQVEQELERLRQEGEPTRLSDLLPPIPPSQDGTPFYQVAIEQLRDAEAKLPKSVMDNFYNFISSQPTQPVNFADVEKVLKITKPALATLRKALDHPHMRLANWDVDIPYEILFPHLSAFREFARLLVAEALWRKRKGDLDGAIDSCATIFRLVRRMGDEPCLISFLVQGAIFFFGVEAAQRVLEDTDVSPKAYQRLLRELRAWDIDRDFVQALQMERVFTIWMYDWTRKKPIWLVNQFFASADDGFELSVWFKGKTSWIAQNALLLLRHYREQISLARKGVPYDWKQVKQIEEKWEVTTEPGQIFRLGNWVFTWRPNAFAEIIGPVWSLTFRKAADFHALQRLGEVAIALRLYRKEHGSYPENLSALVPLFLPSIPTDPFDGKPFRYLKEGKGFRLWSIGQNMKDDGGVWGKRRFVEGDIVWVAVK